MPHVEIRSARPEDRVPVLAFCSNTWPDGDYIEQVWDKWLYDPTGYLFIATVDEQPAGIVYLQMLSNTDAWLQGLRVATQFRRQGLGRELIQAVFLEAMRRGATYIRLTVDANNTTSISLMESSFMRLLGGFSLFTASAQENSSHTIQEKAQLATSADLDEIIDYLNTSNIFPLTGGLYYVNFTAYPITSAFLQTKIAAQHIYLLRRWDRLDGLAIAEIQDDPGQPPNKRLSLGYIDGTAIEAMSLLAYDLQRQMPTLGVKSIRAFVPDILLLRDAFSGIEYAWSGASFYTYERNLE